MCGGGRYVVVGVSASVAVVINWRPAWRLDSAVDRSILVLSVRKWRCCRWTNTSSGRMSGARERETVRVARCEIGDRRHVKASSVTVDYCAGAIVSGVRVVPKFM